MKFEHLKLIDPILEGLKEQGYETPTPIQEKAIPPALEGRDVLGCAQTGTGKTCAFAVPILQRLNQSPVKGHPIRALILTPTRELAIQIGECFAAYGAHLPLRSGVIFGGVSQNPQVEALNKGVDVLIATPGRLADLYNQKLIDLSRLEIFVLDEADRMLDMGFIHDVKRIIAWLPEKKQTLFFSATMPGEITNLVNSLLKNPVRVAVNPISSPVEAIEQRVYFVDKGNKTRLLAQLLEREGVASALVFTRTKHGANKVAGDLTKQGVSAAAIHGNKSQTARQAALAGFKEGSVRVLVATDIAARGLDIEELPYVFNYNLPEVPETYVHRIGRTGRAGHEGIAISFCDFGEKPLLKDIEKLIGRTIPVVTEHDFPMQIFEAPKKDKNGRVVNPEDAEARSAARELKKSRDAAKKAAEKASTQKAAAQPAPLAEQVEKPAGKKQKAQHKKAAPQKETVSPPAPKQTAKKERPYKRPDRTGSLEDYLNAPVEEYDYSEFPLLAQWEKNQGGDKFMDATERMFATHSSKYRSAYAASHPGYRFEESREEEKPTRKGEKSKQPSSGKKKSAKPAGEEKKTSPKEEAPRQSQRKQSPSGKNSAPKAETPKGETPQKGGKSGKGSRRQKKQTQAPESGDRLLKLPRKRRKGSDRPRPIDRSLHATQKDSTEQKSLMKPYYITKD